MLTPEDGDDLCCLLCTQGKLSRDRHDTIAAKMRSVGLTVFETKHLGWGPPDWRLDGRLRGYKMLDDLFEMFGRVFLPRQASSLYLLATKPA